jgi:hypothetical protein
MKRIIIKRLTVLLFLLSTIISASAQLVNVGGLVYYIDSNKHEAVLSSENTWSGELDIPSEIEYDNQIYVVKGISCVAFIGCKELTKVRIPKTIEYISQYYYLKSGPSAMLSPDYKNPFVMCTSLESIEVDVDNPIMSSVNGILFNKSKTWLYCYPAGLRQETYIIPETLNIIGSDAFAYNNNLISMVIPNNVNRVMFGAFSYCKNLKSIKLSENADHIDDYTFDRCESMRFLDVPENVTYLGQSPFRWTGINTFVIRGTFPGELRNDIFYCVSDSAVLYVQNSEISKFKKVFPGTVLPLESFTGINATKPSNNPSSNTIFDLQGRRITGIPSRGVYIKGGKKYVKK